MKKLLIMSLLSVSLCILSNCSIEPDNSNPFSRDYINNSIFSGYGADSQEIIACKYIYNSDVFSNLYGKNFEIKDALCTSAMENSLGLIKGKGDCLIYINDDIWCVELSKDYFRKWAVVDCYQCAVDEDNGDFLVDNNGNPIRITG
ncbi:MAG: hypothetical protein ACI4I4_00620 [Acutalibacteraceae bacterium]